MRGAGAGAGAGAAATNTDKTVGALGNQTVDSTVEHGVIHGFIPARRKGEGKRDHGHGAFYDDLS